MKNFQLSILAILFLITNHVLAQDNEFHLDEVYKISTSGTITLSSDDAEVIITGKDRSDVHVKIDRVVETKGMGWGERHFDVKVSEENGDLRIEDKEWGSQTGFVGYSREEYVIHIEAPNSVSLNIIGDDDNYDISNISGSVKMKVDDGDIRIERCASQSYNFDIDDGDIVLRGADGSLTARMDDGDLSVYNGSLKSFDIRGDDADFDIETSLNDSGTYRFRGDDSSLELYITAGGGIFEVSHDDGNISADQRFVVHERDENYSEFNLPGGNSRVHLSGDDISIRLKSGTIN